MRVFLLVLVFGLVSCGAPDSLRVRQFHLRDTKAATGDLFIRAEMNKRLYGAVSEEERVLRKGNYYHLRWQGLSGAEPVRVVFEYRQARTGARVKRMERVAEASVRGGRQVEITGEDYLKNGRVLAWRATLYDGGALVAKKQSYLWD